MSRFRTYAGPFYFAALLMLLTPCVDFMTNIWPLQLGNIRWRFGATGLFSGMLLTPLFGLLILTAVAVMLDHARVQKLVSVVSWIGALGLLAGAVLFGLDAVQLGHGIPAGSERAFDTTVVRSLVKLVAVAVLLIWLGRASWRGSKEPGARSTAHMGPDVLVREQNDVLVAGP